jgi:peptide/nickel transport system permease protein
MEENMTRREKRTAELVQNTKEPSLARETFKRFMRNKAAVLGAIILIIIILVIIFANVISPKELVTAYNTKERLKPPSSAHWFGTDNLGRDVFTRIVYGSRISVGIGVGATLMSLVIAAILASICALSRPFDFVFMRFIDIWHCIPGLLLMLVMLAALGGSVANMMLTLTLVSIPGFVLHIRSVLLSVVERDYVAAARLSGTQTGKLVRKHIIPNAIDTIIVDATMTVAGMMLSAAGLSAIGMGVAPPSPEWGAMISVGRTYYKTAFYLVAIPGAAVVLTALAVNLVGDGLRDALDPNAIK